MKSFLLFSTQACHLCEQAEALLVSSLDPGLHQIDVIDIAYDDQLLETYGERIPVLQNEQTNAELDWPFDAHQLRLFINK
ncbi:glutaredoxin family protein [Neptunomonas antarctica]|uniref:Glutaredoxin-like domain n=1 Tax=Neptunomonas antarctica TaxID=619304 RepID=A0A1N7KJT9_9GAMM|nr:glutaredoxin family protein [Neptunomonas antarctica]SIS61817.1 Glutaredoxin-like domain [Neptunomonas antarctica]